MPKKVTTAQLKKLQKSGATIITKKEPKTKLDTSTSSDEMKAAVLASKAAVSIAKTAETLVKDTQAANRLLLSSMVEVMTGNQVIKLKINRGKDKFINDVDIIRAKG